MAQAASSQTANQTMAAAKAAINQRGTPLNKLLANPSKWSGVAVLLPCPMPE